MRKKIKLSMMTVFLLLFLATISSASAANTYNINETSYNDYFDATGYINNPTVQAGDVLDCSGTLTNKDMYIDRPLNITSSDQTGTLVNGVITILTSGSGTNITNLKFNNHNHNGDTPGTIVINQADNTTIVNNTINTTQTGDNSYGIHLIEANNNQITGNTIITTGNGSGTATGGNGNFNYGIYLEESSNNVFESNSIKTTGTSADIDWSDWMNGGIYATLGLNLDYSSSYNEFINNTITTDYNDVVTDYDYDSLLGVHIHTDCCYNTIANNIINTNGNTYVYGLEVVGGTDTADNNTISGNTINTTGVTSATSVKVSASTKNTTITGNKVQTTADDFAYGIYLENYGGLENVTVTSNKVTTIGNINYAIELFCADSNTVTNNILVGTGSYSMGIGTYYSNNNTISHNTITTIGDNSAPHIPNSDSIPEGNEGIKLYMYSDQNTVEYNIISSSAIYAVDSSSSTTNTITNNYLVSDNNNRQGNNAVDPGTGDVVTDNYGNIPPTITTTDPVNGATNVPADKIITVTFSQAIEEGSNFWIELVNSSGTAIPFTTNITGNILTITPSADLAESRYKLMLHSGCVTDIAGNPLAGKSITFTVGTAPTITATNPVNGATNVAADKIMTITFNEDIKAGTDWIELVNSSGTAIPFTTNITGNILTITPTTDLAESRYKLMLHSGCVTDLAGIPLAGKSITFSVGSSPTITATNPVDGATNVSTAKTLTVTFDQAIRKSSTFWVELVDSLGTPVTYTSYIIGSNMLVIKPTSDLATNTTYKLKLHTGCVTDLAGNPLAGTSISFTTRIT